MKARKPIVKVKAVKPSPAELKAMKEKLKANIAWAKWEYNIAENKFEALEAELECQREFFDDADNDLQDAEYDLEEFNDLVQYAKDFDDWKHVVNFKSSR